MLYKGANGVKAKFIGIPIVGPKKKAIWVPKTLVTNLQGVAELPKITHLRRRSSSTRHLRILSSTPQGRTQIIHIFPPWSNNENEFTILSPFYTTRVLRNTLLQYQVQSAEFKQGNYNKYLTVEYKDPSVLTRRILHTKATLQAAPATG